MMINPTDVIVGDLIVYENKIYQVRAIRDLPSVYDYLEFDLTPPQDNAPVLSIIHSKFQKIRLFQGRDDQQA